MTATRAQARAAGACTFAGSPCRFGHSGERYVSKGNCVECERVCRKARWAVEASTPRHGVKPFVQARVVNFLREKEGGWVRTAELVAYAYGTATIEDPVNSLARAVLALRQRGFPIASSKGLGYRYAPELWTDLPTQEQKAA